jgi:hypothetical protein
MSLDFLPVTKRGEAQINYVHGATKFRPRQRRYHWMKFIIRVARPKSRIPGSACRRGHALTGDNVYAAPDGHVQCKRCRADHREAKRLRNAAIRAAIAAGAPEEALEALIAEHS